MMHARRALVCAPLMPEFDRECGSKRIYNTITSLQDAGWAVSFVAQNGRGGERYERLLRRRGVATYCGFGPKTSELIAAGEFDLAIFAFWHLAEELLPLVRSLSPCTRVVVDSIDLHFVRNARRIFQRADSRGDGALDAEYSDELTRELNTYARADGVLAVSEKEADLLNDLVGDPTLTFTVPLGEDMPPSPIPRDRRRGILFLGNFRHPPNVQAVEYLCKEVLPLVDPRVLESNPVTIVGNALDERVRRFGAGLDSVKMVGWVPSVQPYMERSLLSVIPLLYGAGTKGKLVQALMVGTPTVSTTVGVEGLHLADGEHVLIADDPASFARAIERLAGDPAAWERLSARGRAHVTAAHSLDAAGRRLEEAASRVLLKEPKAFAAPAGDAGAPRGSQAADYRQLRGRIADAVARATPRGATILVVSRGDDELLKIPGRRGWHFPRGRDGAYAGHHPADSRDAISRLDAAREAGGQYLLLPRTASWWLEHYSEFAEHLEANYRTVLRDDDCTLYELR